MSGVLTVAYFFDPGGAVGALRPWRFHRFLKDLGYASRVVAAFTASDSDPEITLVRDTATAYWERRGVAIAAGQGIEPIPLDGQLERLLKKTIYAGQFGVRWSVPAAAAAAALVRRNASLTHVLSTYPPIGGHLAAMQVARRARLPWIADFRDPMRHGPNALSRLYLGALEKRLFREASAIIANTEFAAAGWRELYPWAASKIHVIWNGYDPDRQLVPLPVPERAGRWLVHAGQLYGGRHANAVIAALGRLRSAGSAEALSVRVVLAGPCDQSSGIDIAAYEQAAREGWLVPPGNSIPRAEAERLTQEADGLLLLQPQSTDQVPAKLFEYLCVGRPILALVPRKSAIEWILSQAGVPFVAIYTSDDAETADAKMRSWLALPRDGARANQWFRDRFDARRQTAQLAAILEATRSSGPG